MKYGERIGQIMREERERTAEAIFAMELSERIQEDVKKVFLAVQEAINRFVGREDRTLDGRIAPAALRAEADEIERVQRRLEEEGLAPWPDAL